jgi:RNA polymerase sigma-70 factor (ECF subfamily)
VALWKIQPALSALRTPAAAHEAPAVEQTFERLFEENVDFICRSAHRLGIQEREVEDVAQQVFIIAYRKLPEFEGRSSSKTWLFSILLRVASDHRRSSRRKGAHLVATSSDPDQVPDQTPTSDPHERLERIEASRIIDRLLDTLEDDKRAVFVMAELEQMTAAEIAEATGIDTKAVYSRLRAARIAFERAAERMRKRSERVTSES